MRLDSLSQITYEYWKDTALEHAKRKVSYYESLDKTKMGEAIKTDTIDLIRNGVGEDIRSVHSDCDESYIRNLLLGAAERIDYGSVADKICYEYIP